MAGIRATLDRYRVRFDRWFLERSLYEGAPSAWDRAREKLLADGHAYESEGALWLRTTTLAGDEKDRPLVKSSGEPTYLAADVAYHWDKLDRGFDRSSTCSAPTTTATSCGSGRSSPRRAPIPTGSSCRCSSSCTSSRAASAPRCPSAAATSSRSTS